ncbi:MAG: hypothetical protein A3B44_03205 [Candidatus Levybacteria bacterium RIFCSPLOWO2_01_FULL_38_21]|nr:MAG: hypothetical protein A3B44_03205 [Candidatus Levybacteria bacterium RIFCSPLOWO2_01_FULL_38_21]
MNNNHHNNRFFDGFLWGAIIGGGLVFFLSTKKGKKLLETITKEGVGGLSEILEAQMDEEEPEEDGEEMEQVVEEPKIINGNGVTKNNSEQAESQEVKLPHRRFFRKKPA